MVVGEVGQWSGESWWFRGTDGVLEDGSKVLLGSAERLGRLGEGLDRRGMTGLGRGCRPGQGFPCHTSHEVEEWAKRERGLGREC